MSRRIKRSARRARRLGEGKKLEVVELARKIHLASLRERADYDEARHAEQATCAHLAVSTIMAAREHGIDLVLQAGTAMFRAVAEHLDDGVSPTHFSYEYQEGANFADHMARGHLPEIHVWAGDVERQHVVDLTTRYLPAQCERVMGVPWRADAPPDFLWGKPPRDWIYEPSREATLLIHALAEKGWI